MKTFDFGRFGAFLRFEFLSRRQETVLPLVVPTALLCAWGLLLLATGLMFESWPGIPFVVGLFLALGGAANAHRREMETATAPFQLMIPVSHGERFATRLLLGLVLPFFGQILILTLVANGFALVGAALGRGFSQVLVPDFASLVSELGFFLAAHSVFFAGGVFFRGNAFVKTLLAALAYGFVLGVALVVLSASGLAEKTSFQFTFPSNVGGAALGNGAATALTRMAWNVVLPLLLYVAAYFKIRENEVRG